MSENPARHLSAAAEAVRAFNHTSRSVGDGWYFPSDSYTALGSLSHLVSMLGQVISQATRPVMNTHEQMRILIDGGGDPDAAVAELVDAREQAFAAAGALTAAVQRMHNITSPMGMDTRGLPGFEDEPPVTYCHGCSSPMGESDDESARFCHQCLYSDSGPVGSDH